MAKLLSYPHFVITVEDQSRNDDVVADDLLGLHVPLFFGRYARGVVNKPIWCPTTNDLYRIFGKEWTDNLTSYFTHESLFIERNFSSQGAFIVRLASEDAMTASILLEAHVTTGVEVIQYKRDEYDKKILDENGDPIPLMNESNQPIKEAGVRIKWTSRALDPETESNIKTLKPTTTDNGDGTTTVVYPVIAAICKYPGLFGNNLGFRFYFNTAEQQNDRLNDNKALEYSFSPIELDYTDNNPRALRDIWNSTYCTFMLKPKQYDSKVMQNISCEEVLQNNYQTDTKSELPFEFYPFTDYVKEIGQKIIDVETNDINLVDPYLVNIFSLTNLDDIEYHHIEVDNSEGSIFFNSNYTIYLQNGSDGDTSQEAYEELIRQFLALDVFPELKDRFRYPITHLYDTGYSNDTKEAMIEFLSLRDDVRVELTTQDLSNEINDASEDQSVGLYLRTRALLQPESTLKGTDCCRASIYCHCGKVYDTRYTGWVPATLDILGKRCEWQSTTYMKGEPKGRPHSEVDIFKSLSWTAFDEDNKNLFWESGINYIQHFNRTGIFWPDLRTVYTSDTSVLSEWSFVDAVVYAKHIIRQVWTIYTGSTTPVEELYTSIENKINDELRKAYNGRYTTRVKAWRSEQDAKLGYLCRVTLYITGRTSQRVWECEIVTFKDETVISNTTEAA